MHGRAVCAGTASPGALLRWRPVALCGRSPAGGGPQRAVHAVLPVHAGPRAGQRPLLCAPPGHGCQSGHEHPEGAPRPGQAIPLVVGTRPAAVPLLSDRRLGALRHTGCRTVAATMFLSSGAAAGRLLEYYPGEANFSNCPALRGVHLLLSAASNAPVAEGTSLCSRRLSAVLMESRRPGFTYGSTRMKVKPSMHVI